ncbi:MAG: CDP-alcohol phosphatidyltransferase family protein [Defluviitaleaceae bacterium]|nr:CDP-alcohol phosphatidyltransferase family protein [Defluviitaleaceae bacterium]
MKIISKYFPALGNLNVPNAITTIGMVLCIAACYYLVGGNFMAAMVCLFFAGVCDLVDGWFASKLNQQSRFGQAIDSLVDFFSCVIMPVWIVHSFMAYNWPMRIGLVFYCICGLWRLAYYNINEADKSFTGLPVPGAMMIVVIVTWAILYANFPVWALTVTFFIVGILMISCFKLAKYGKWQIIMGLIGLAFFITVLIIWLI